MSYQLLSIRNGLAAQNKWAKKKGLAVPSDDRDFVPNKNCPTTLLNKFGTVIADEAHLIKNHDTRWNGSVRMLTSNSGPTQRDMTPQFV